MSILSLYWRAFIVALLSLPVYARAQESAALRAPIGLRDMVGAGLYCGIPFGLRADMRFLPVDNSKLALELYYGGTGATWGLGETYAALLRLDMDVTDDRSNDAMIVAPGLGVSAMEPSLPGFHGWWDWTPYTTVHSILAVCELSWVHEFSAWSLELGAAPGENYAIGGRDQNNEPANGKYSFQFTLYIDARFFH